MSDFNGVVTEPANEDEEGFDMNDVVEDAVEVYEEGGDEASSRGDANPYSVETMKQYFNSISNINFSDDKKEALSIIKNRVNNDSEDGNSFFQAELLTNAKKGIMKELIELLKCRINEKDRQTRLGKNLVTKWFEAKNSERVFFFFSKRALEKIAAGEPYNFILKNAASRPYDKLISEIVARGKSVNLRNSTDNQEDESASSNTIRQSRKFVKPSFTEVL